MRRLFALTLVALASCAHAPRYSATQPLETIDPKLATVAYWTDQPSTAEASSADFDRLWDASENTAREMLFPIDRRDRRLGIMTTDAITSGQPFELWRDDTLTEADTAEATLANIRRSIRYEFTQHGSTWSVVPKVVIERQTRAERRASNAVQYNGLLRRSSQRGTRESDQGFALSSNYWYAIGRDAPLEAKIARHIERRVESAK